MRATIPAPGAASESVAVPRRVLAGIQERVADLYAMNLGSRQVDEELSRITILLDQVLQGPPADKTSMQGTGGWEVGVQPSLVKDGVSVLVYRANDMDDTKTTTMVRVHAGLSGDVAIKLERWLPMGAERTLVEVNQYLP